MSFSLDHSIKHPIGTAAITALLLIGAWRLQAAQQPGPLSPVQQAPVPAAPLPPEQLQELVAPIALYPDSLVAQILAAATYPTQIVEAERFLEQNPGLIGAALGSAVDQQDWDPSVKALTAFPSVLSDMNQNLSWTSELGDANYNQSADVMNAIQFMRRKAQEAGHLNSSPQEAVSDEDGNVAIAPADPEVVYVPEYDPEYVYGYPVGLWPGFDPWWGVGGPYMSFGLGIGVGQFFGFGWGWNHWGFGWGRGGGLMFGGNRYFSNSRSFYDRNAFMHGNYRGFGGRGEGGFFGGGDRGGRVFGGSNRGGGAVSGANRGRGFEGGGQRSLRGFGGRGSSGMRSGAFGGFSGGGDARGFSSRGMSSMRGGFGGGMRGGGGRR